MRRAGARADRQMGGAGSRCGLFGSRLRQPERERGALAHFAFRTQASAVPFDDALDRRQPDAVPGVLGFGMQALERPEQLGCVLRGEPGAVVADEELALCGPPDLDPRLPMLAFTLFDDLPEVPRQSPARM